MGRCLLCISDFLTFPSLITFTSMLPTKTNSRAHQTTCKLGSPTLVEKFYASRVRSQVASQEQKYLSQNSFTWPSFQTKVVRLRSKLCSLIQQKLIRWSMWPATTRIRWIIQPVASMNPSSLPRRQWSMISSAVSKILLSWSRWSTSLRRRETRNSARKSSLSQWQLEKSETRRKAKRIS